MIFFQILIIFSIAFINTKLGSSCGVTTHIEIAHRASTHYDYLLDEQISVYKLIQKYQSAFQAGAPFPDAFYWDQCKKGAYHQVSEDTHWVPFLNASINYFRKTYSKPYNEDALRLIVFILGFTSHQIADVTWHSLGVDQGFLTTMGFVNFHGSFEKAHSVGDFGGDVLNQFELDLEYVSYLNEWYIPVNDLSNIYIDLYGKEIISKQVIIECSTILYLARLGEKLALSLLYPDINSKSVFLADKLNDYFLGGLDDMAAWTQLSWNKVVYMLENGSDKCDLQYNIIDLNCNISQSKLTNKKRFRSKTINYYENEKLNLINNKYNDVEFLNVTVLKNNAVLISSSKKYQVAYKASLRKYSFVDKSPKFAYKKSNMTYFISNEYANLGWSLATGDMNNDQIDDLIISAPVYSTTNLYQNGAVFVLFSEKYTNTINHIDVETMADIIFLPPANILNARFGHAVLVLDLNQDGFDDIVISAPSYNLRNVLYQGRIFIYFGGRSNTFNSTDYSIEITCEIYQYCNLGWSLSKGDIDGDNNDDLIISSPYARTCSQQCGFVGVLFSKKTFPNKIDAKNLDWILSGNMPYEWFGHSAVAKYGYLAVGAPQSRLCELPNCELNNGDKQAIGRVYIFKYPSDIPITTLNGTDTFEQFGSSFDISKQLNSTVIAVSSISKDSIINKHNAINLKHGGIVQVYDINENTLIASLKSDRSYASFGSKVKFYDLNNDDFDDLVIGSQLRSDSFFPIAEVQQGLVYAFKGGPSFPQGNFTDDCTGFIPCPEKRAYMIFENIENKSRFGSEFTLLKSLKGNKLAISSVHSNFNSKRLSGRVNIFDLN